MRRTLASLLPHNLLLLRQPIQSTLSPFKPDRVFTIRRYLGSITPASKLRLRTKLSPSSASTCTNAKSFKVGSDNLSHSNTGKQLAVYKSSNGSLAVLLFIGIVGGATVYAFLPANEQSSPEDQEAEDQRVQTLEDSADYQDKMVAELSAGRPGSLTAEEELKLKEFWIATLDVFGVLNASDVEGSEAVADPTPGVARVDSKKPKKKRLGMFRSKDKGDETKADAKKTGDDDDKHGQTKQYHEALATIKPEVLRETFWSMVKHDHPDGLLLRFLRARKWDIEKALVMMISTMKWRSQEFKVDTDIMKNGELGSLEDSQSTNPELQKMGAGFMMQMRLGKSFLHGTDKLGRPMCFVRARLHKQGDQTEESLERYTVFVIETARMLLSPPVDTACVIFDLSGFSLANMDYGPVKFMIQCFEANYPESLGVVLIHKAPWVFQGIWKVIKGWLDPVVASKIQFTNDEKSMEEFIPQSQIIKELNGGEDWEMKYVEPVPGENDLMKDTVTRDKLLEARKLIVNEYESSVLSWIHGKLEPEVARKKRDEVALKLRDDYWKLDPYVRARSYYDRIGVINPGGKIQFYPGAKSDPAVANPVSAADDID